MESGESALGVKKPEALEIANLYVAQCSAHSLAWQGLRSTVPISLRR